MATIDDKVVAMSFESSKFEQGVNSAISALEKLKAALHFPSAGKGLDDLNASAKRVDLGFIQRGIESVKNALGTLRLVGIGVLTHLANMAVDTGLRFAKAFTLDPVKAGFTEYTTNLNAVQTILANTAAAGTKLADVNKALKELNDYSDKTIYNFSQMAKNIGTFTAAGVDLDTATDAIKGIANLAALSGSNAEQASTAMYQLSQAISAGRVSLQDWNSVVNAGMGGTVFQRALAQTAVAMGKLDEGALKLTGSMKNVTIHGESFRNSVSAKPGEKSWLTSDVLTATLAQFTGDLTKAELKAQGFNDAQIKAIQQTANTAMKAATEVKTLQGVLDTAKETAGSGWAQTWQIIFGDFGEAKVLFTNVSNAINGFIKASADARNKVLGDWKALGGRTVLIDAIRTAFHNLGMVVAPIKEAFRDMFPAVTGKNLYDLTVRFKEFADALKPTPTTVENLKRTFSGLFALMDIGKQVLSGIFSVFTRLLGIVTDNTGGFLNFTGNIGDFLVAIDKMLKKGNYIQQFFDRLADILAVPAEMVKTLSGSLVSLFSGALPGDLAKSMAGLGESMSPLQAFVNNLAKSWNALLIKFQDVARALGPAFDAILDLISGLGTAIGEAAANMNFEAILSVIRTGFLGGLVLMFKQFLGKGSAIDQITKGFGGGILENISGTFKALQGSMVALQQNIKAKTLKEIAIAVGILAASVLALSFVDPKRLQSSLTAMTVAFGQLLGAMAILGNVSKSMGFIKMPVISASLIILAGAITALSVAVVILSRLSWEDLLKGLVGVAALLGTIVLAVGPLSANSAGMIKAGIGITAIAIALNLLALAVRQMAGLSLTELGKGLGAVAVGLGIMILGMKLMPPGMALAGAGLIAVAVGLRILANAVEKFGGMDLKTIGKGMAAVAAGLIIIGLAMRLMPANMVVTAAGLLIVSLSLGRIAAAIERMGGLSVREIAKGLGTLAGALILLAGALYVMQGALGGAAALGIAAAGLALLAPALVAMGRQSWESIIKGLVGLGAALAILGIAGAVLGPTIPALIGLGAALVLIGGGLALAGAGIFLISTGLSALVVAAPTGVGVILAAFVELQEGIIKNAKLMILGVLEIVKALADTAPMFVDAIVKILNSLLDAIVAASPKIGEAFDALITLVIGVLNRNQGRIIQAGFDLLVALLQGIKNNIPQLVTLVADIIAKFLSGIANNLGKIIQAGSQILISLVKGIAQHYADVVTAVLDIIAKFLGTIASNLGKVATAGLSILTKLLEAIAGGIGKVIKMGVDIVVAFINGIGDAGPRIIAAGVNAIIKFINALSSNSVKLVDAGMKAVINFLNGIANAIDANAGQMRAAGMRVGIAIIDGMTGGLVSKAGELYGKIESVMNKAVGLLHKIPGVKSPSTVTYNIGEMMVAGLVEGMDANADDVYSSAEAMSNGTINAFKNVFQITSPSKVMHEIGQAVGQGFAQGLKGSGEDIKNAFTDLNGKLTDAMVAARETIAKEEDKLAELRKAKKPDANAIREAQKIIDENEAILARSTAGHIALTKTLADEKKELIGLTADYDKISEKLNTAQDALANAMKTRDDAVRNFAAKYGALPEIVTEDAEGHAVDQLATYMGALKHEADAVAAYHSTLQQLRQLGLDDATYQKLLDEGTMDQAFADQLLAGGKTAVDALNVLDKNLMKVSATLAKNAGNNLYQAGVDAAAGLVKGLKSKRSDIRQEMEEIAREILTTLKKELKIKSPSEAFAEIGVSSMEGMAKGIEDSSKGVTDAVDTAAKDALTQMERSMRGMSEAVASELNTEPVITPILDLTQVRDQARELSTLTAVTPITAAASYGQASIISSQQAAQTEQATVIAGQAPVIFEQNNYSPQALTEIEIYRQTKNQLSQLKSVLAIT